MTILTSELDPIRAAHPDWDDDQCIREYYRARLAAYEATHRQTLVEGDRVHFAGEKRPYTVRAANARWAICTKPFNLKRTTLYTIIDFERDVRGRENLIFGMGFETDEDCRRALMRLVEGESEVSYRHCVSLDVK
jgi:hypothetical protein